MHLLIVEHIQYTRNPIVIYSVVYCVVEGMERSAEVQHKNRFGIWFRPIIIAQIFAKRVIYWRTQWIDDYISAKSDANHR